ncbi:MAG: hypothetical protein KIS87_15015 [Phycisphaeraceae bacterium]|nr:hypothetical protein [Phycisphaeraceae bacterium]
MTHPRTDNTPSPARFVVELRADPQGRDRFGREPSVRLRLLLKLAGRGLGLRCTAVRTVGGGVEADGSGRCPGVSSINGRNEG